MIRTYLDKYMQSWWMPSLAYLLLCALSIFTLLLGKPLEILSLYLFSPLAFISFIGIMITCFWNLNQRRWGAGIFNGLAVIICPVITALTTSAILFGVILSGPSEDGFADNLSIPTDIELSEPETHASPLGVTSEQQDELQKMVRAALEKPGGQSSQFVPSMPSLRSAATDHPDLFRAYVEASPDWHVFGESGNHFASRRWSYAGDPGDTLHGYISDFGGGSDFQTRCLICLDRKPWSRYSVQHVQEGTHLVQPDMTEGNSLQESRVMIECGGVWVEIFEQSSAPERRITQATIAALEKEFAEFQQDPAAALEQARSRSRELARKLASADNHPILLLEGMQPGIYKAVYAVNPGEPGYVYLKAYEITQGTRLSESRLTDATKTRMAWSSDPDERFGAKTGFTIYEGYWGKPYAARFEVWFIPDSGQPERKLAERNYKIEGWQR
ncbi:hypothetical protein SAMN02745181_0320 [Rubritalea squalenifaciens DSM 18772]|uniref:Uncharacterized protein n=1 Tax=Rubritalea squalenifaciens DSM 18772 TaxID=1123071 RepID=A0A1M6BVC0_9BACT|nr:hypothetical protein [Rubritalea squalenifaciens]SHI52742.1 hypothetical protein SAMN02745181_0320 [Rubritalea squalenifaciens DSM 18772]